MESAKEYLAKNDRNAAVIQLKTALQKKPDYAEARFLLGKALLETGDIASAEKELRKAAELKYPLDQIAPPLARAVLFRGAYRKVIDEFGKTEVTSPLSKAEFQTTLGQAWLGLGNAEAARASFAQAQAAIPNYPMAVLGEARFKVLQGDVQGANALVEGALARSPDLIEGWLFKGDLARAQGRLDDALAAYRKALEIRPTYVAALSRIVSVLLLQGKTDEAGKQLDALKMVAPKHPQTLYLRALLNLREKKYPAAREAVQQFLRAWPDNVQGLMLSASIDYDLRSFAQAEAELQRVLQRVPTEKLARVMLVRTYIQSGQPARAQDALKPLLEAGDEDSDILTLAGEVFTRNGDHSQAARYFAKAAALDPKNSGKRTSLALSRIAASNNEQAFHDLQDAAAADSGIRADLALIAASTSKGRYDMAMDAIAALEKKPPGKALANNLRGSVLVAKGDTAGARKSFEQAAAQDPADFTAASNLANLDLADQKPVEAKKRFEAVLAKDPKNTSALLALAELRARTGAAPAEVVALIGKAVTADPTNTAPRLALITYYMNAKEPRKAVAAAQDALAAMPDRAELLYAAGQAQQAAGDSNQAAKSYSKLAQVRPGSPLPYMKEAEAQIANKDYDGALQSLRKALEIKPDLLDAQRALVAVYFLKDRVDDALGVARDVQKQRPTEAIGYVLEGDIYASKKQWTEAVNVYRKGLSRTANTDLAAKTAAAMNSAGKVSEADTFASAWVKDHPKDTRFRAFLAESAVVKGDFATAVRQYKLILEVTPDDAVVLNNLAWASGELKDPKAVSYAEKANRLVPDNPAFLDTLGVLLVANGEMKRGVESLQRATALAPNAPALRFNLARALLKDGQKEAAKKELEILAKLGDKFPGHAEVTKLKEGL
uniref:Putative PEP-CTERM system TPR-repeat lipoprotein n=1 Tax=uncultured bacterium CSL11 TaxID=1091566 RepID=G4WVF2_9BACT|nr:putative PEP-CTERM system TPR-repeat lipoprotein [uncultured bacterium CSL11]